METETQNSGWQGRSRSESEPQHRWASDWNELQKREFTARPNKTRRRVLCFLLFVIGLSCAFIYAVSFYPKRTPMATIILTGYDAPLPPNAGAFDDLNALQALHDKNLSVEDISGSWQNKQAGLNRLDQFFKSLLVKRKKDDAIIVYINGYGAVNDKGAPCLLVPGYEPRQTEHWLEMEILLERIRSTVKGRIPVALVVDCVKSRRNWKMGILSNQWQSELKNLVAKLDIENLIVLTSAGSNQINEYSRTLKSTTFGHFLQLGLAGHADRQNDSDSSVGGNNDGTVTATELESYLRRNVSEWARIHHADVQVPELLSGSRADFPLVSSLNRRAIKRLESLPETQIPSSVSASDVANLWKTLDRFRSADRIREQPTTVHKFESDLVRLEQLSTAGTGFDERAAELSKTIRVEMERELKTEQAPTASFVSDETENTSGTFGSIYSNRYFGRISQDDVERMTETFLSVSASQQNEDFSIGERFGKPQPLESFLARWLNELNRSGIWNNLDPSSRFANLHLNAEKACWPRDVRSLRWATDDLENADRNRRLAFDSLFTGDKDSFERSMQAASQVYDAQLNDGISPLRTAEQCLLLRDQAIAEFAALAEWHTRWESPYSDANKDERQAKLSRTKAQLVNFCELLNEFSSELSQPEQMMGAAELLGSYRMIRNEFDSIRNKFLSECETLSNAASLDGNLVFDIKAALKSPIVPWETREKLIEKLSETQTKIFSEQSEKSDSSDESFQIENRLSDGIDQLIGESEIQNELDNQPLLSFFQIKTADSLDEAGAATRNLLNNASERVFVTNLASPDQIDAADMEPGPYRERMASIALWGRKLASVAVVESNFNPVHDYLRFELQQALLWHADRGLNDFFGPLPDSNLSQMRPEPTFSAIASPLLDHAQRVTSVSPFTTERLAELRERLRECVNECESMISLAATAEPKLNDASDTTLRVNLKTKRDTLPTIDNRPEGFISVRMRSQRSSKWGAGFFVDYPVPESGVSKLLSVNNQSGTQLTSFFRGHEFKAPVFLRKIGGHRVEFFPQKKPNSTVTLVGKRKGRSSIVFILDCSQSMAKEIQAELIGEKQVPRLSLAKNSLVTMLDELAQRKDARVGVRLFGHRIGWTVPTEESPTSIRLRQKNYEGQIPDLLIPENDVELLLPLGRFTQLESNAVTTRLRSVKPWGQSPLNLAIKQALNDFEKEDADTQKSIVVITDGVNYQVTPSTNSVSIPKNTKLSDVTNELEKTNVPIFILGFGISDDEKQEAEKEFFSIAEKSGGGYFAIESGQELLETLRSQLQLGRYQVLNASQNPVESKGEEFIKLNDEVEIPVDGKFKVVFDTIELDVTTEGQEALKFRLLEKESKIVAIPYDVLDPTISFMRHEEESGRIVLRAHRPSNFENGFVFPISIQSQDQAFTPRPKDIWVEISPRTNQNEVEQGGPLNGRRNQTPETNEAARELPFVFYDRDFSDGTPVPLKRCLVSNWPPSSSAADITVFCKFTETKPSTSIPLSEWMKPNQKEWQKLDGFNGVRYKVVVDDNVDGDALIRVFEEHQATSAGLYSLRVDIGRFDSVRPLKVTRQFDSENMMAVHTFQFKRADFDQLRSEEVNANIDFTTKASLRSGAWKMTETSMQVRLFEEIGLLPVEAATGQR